MNSLSEHVSVSLLGVVLGEAAHPSLNAVSLYLIHAESSLDGGVIIQLEQGLEVVVVDGAQQSLFVGAVSTRVELGVEDLVAKSSVDRRTSSKH